MAHRRPPALLTGAKLCLALASLSLTAPIAQAAPLHSPGHAMQLDDTQLADIHAAGLTLAPTAGLPVAMVTEVPNPLNTLWQDLRDRDQQQWQALRLQEFAATTGMQTTLTAATATGLALPLVGLPLLIPVLPLPLLGLLPMLPHKKTS